VGSQENIRKGKKQRVSLKDIPLTRSQVIMRDEMLTDDKGLFATDHTVRPQQEEAARHAGLVTVGDALDTVLGKQSPDADQRDRRISGMAQQIIFHGPGLALGLNQWAHVQAMIEEGIRQGVTAAQSGTL